MTKLCSVKLNEMAQVKPKRIVAENLSITTYEVMQGNEIFKLKICIILYNPFHNSFKTRDGCKAWTHCSVLNKYRN